MTHQQAELNQLQKILGGTITKLLKDGDESFGFRVEKANTHFDCWVDCDPEGNGPGHVDIITEEDHKELQELLKPTPEETVPGCQAYAELLQIASEKFGITVDQARDRFGLLSTDQWKTLLAPPTVTIPTYRLRPSRTGLGWVDLHKWNEAEGSYVHAGSYRSEGEALENV